MTTNITTRRGRTVARKTGDPRADEAAQDAAGQAAPAIPEGVTCATWKGHGNPQKFDYWGSGAAPEDRGRPIAKVVKDGANVIALKLGNGRTAASMGVSGKFWAGNIDPDSLTPATRERKGGTGQGRGRVQATTAEGATLAEDLAVIQGPPAWRDSNGEVMPMTATAYPELVAADGAELRCLGACGQLKPAKAFPVIVPGGKGRFVECGACQRARLAANKAAKAEGKPTTDRPRAAVQAPAA